MLARALESEFREFFKRMGVMGWIGHFLAVAFFGVVVPLRQGIEFFDVMFLLAYACLPCVFAAPLVAESVAGRRVEPPEAGYMAQVLMPFLFASTWNLLILSSGFATVNVSNWHGGVLLPPTAVLCNVVLFSLSITLFACATTAWLSLNLKTAAAAKSQARRVFLLLLVVILMWARMGSPRVKQAVAERLTSDRITSVALPVAALLLLSGIALLRVGVRRRQEEAAGPLLKL